MDGPFTTSADPALIDLFRAESDTHIPVLSQGLLALEKRAADDAAIASMMRAAHSIKGAARIVGIDAAVRVAHAMEDCFTAAKENAAVLSSDSVDVLLQGVDALQRICALQPESDMTEAWLASLVEQLAGVKAGRAPMRAKIAPATPAQHVEPAPAPVGADSTAEIRVTLPAEFEARAAEAVRGQLLEGLGAGPVAIRLDFAGVNDISTEALALLASLAREVARPDVATTLRAEGVSPPVAALLRTTGLERALGPGG